MTIKTMKHRVNLVGDTFTHTFGGNKGYSIHGKVSKYVEWVFDGSGSGTVYVDQFMKLGMADGKSGKKYGFLLESRPIRESCSHGFHQWLHTNVEQIFSVFTYVFTHDAELLALDERFKWCGIDGTWIEEPQMYPKSKLVSMIASNKELTSGHSKRIAISHKLRDKLDFFGRGIRPIDKKEEGLCEYMFSVVIENAEYSSYYTEKLLDCFATGTIPIYLGCPDIERHFNADGIIRLTDDFDPSTLTAEMYESKLAAVQENFEKVRDILIPEDYIYVHYLQPQHP